MNKTIDKYDDIIDSRDVIARIEELESERDSQQETDRDEARAQFDAENEKASVVAKFDEDKFNAIWEWSDADLAEELKTLKALAEEGENCSDWSYGETLIRDSYFRTYAEELADDIGAIDSNAHWPMTCIDWERAARELQMDYTSIDFDGITYWMRS
jgi:hypothetical protein